VLYLIGEAYWSLHRPGDARRAHTTALPELRRVPPTPDVETMVAKILVRLGRIREAEPIYARLVAASPGDIHLVLDYAIGRLKKSRELIEQARGLEPRHPRLLRLDAEVLLKERRYEESAAAYRQALRAQGADAGLEAGLGYALELGGAWRDAVAAYGRSLTLQPGNRDVERARHGLDLQIGRWAGARASYRFTADDEALELGGEASLRFRDDRGRLSFGLGLGRFSGRAAVFQNGTADVEETIASIRASLRRRFRRRHEWAAGFEAYPGAEGGLPLGGWASLRLRDENPNRELSLRAGLNELLRDPTAAVGLGGRRHGVVLRGTHGLGLRWWVGGSLGLDALSIDPPGGAGETDQRFTGTLSAGTRILRDTPHLSAWASYTRIGLLGDRNLANLIPVGDRFDYLTAGVRLETERDSRLLAAIEGYAGYELHDANGVWGLSADLVYRPRRNARGLELRFGGSIGSSIGRTDTDLTGALHLGTVWRW
ncbi:MAG: hypothetical protein ACE5JG_13605, partial [Planctomycetota bacterium]